MRFATAVVLVTFLVSGPVWAQDAKPSPEPEFDVTKLGVSIKRIQQGLFIAESREKRGGDAMHLEFNVQVYGQSPKIEVLKGVDLFNGAVPGTAPSHGQMIEFWTPQIYRTPGLPISALAFWAAERIWQVTPCRVPAARTGLDPGHPSTHGSAVGYSRPPLRGCTDRQVQPQRTTVLPARCAPQDVPPFIAIEFRSRAG